MCQILESVIYDWEGELIVIAGDFNHDVRKMDGLAKRNSYNRTKVKTRLEQRLDCIYSNQEIKCE